MNLRPPAETSGPYAPQCDTAGDRVLDYVHREAKAGTRRIRWELLVNGWSIAATLLGVWMLGGVGGCAVSRGKPSLTAEDPALLVPAIKSAERGRGKDSLPALVAGLSDEDPGIRMLTSHSLEARTGKTFGYRYFDDFQTRQQAVQKWNAWLSEQGLTPLAGTANARSAATDLHPAPATQPASQPSGQPASPPSTQSVFPVAELGLRNSLGRVP